MEFTQPTLVLVPIHVSTEQYQLVPATQGQTQLLVSEEGQRESVQAVNFKGKKGHRVLQGLDSVFH